MNKQKTKLFFLAVLMVLFSSRAMATAEADFNKGNELFKQGDYSSAVMRFKRAEKQGMKTVALHYNLASSYYKLEDYDNSKRYFKLVAQSSDMQDLAEYNLGLIELEVNNRKEAKQYFSDIVSKGKDKKLVALSKRKLADIQRIDDQWRVFIFANVGYDDNIMALPSEAVSDQSDSFYNLFTSVDAVIAGKRKDGWLADVTYSRIDFSDTDNFDDNRTSLGLRRESRLAGWDTKIHLNLSKNNFAGEDFQTVTKLDVSANALLSRTEKVFLRYIFESISSDDFIYDYLEGKRHRARVEYRDYTSKNIKQIYYELELNDRGDLVTSTYAYEYSPTRHTVRGKYTQILSETWHLTGDLSYRVSDFPESLSFDRNDEQTKLSLSVDYRFDKTFKLKTSVKFIANESTVDQYDYDKTMMTVGISKLF